MIQNSNSNQPKNHIKSNQNTKKIRIKNKQTIEQIKNTQNKIEINQIRSNQNKQVNQNVDQQYKNQQYPKPVKLKLKFNQKQQKQKPKKKQIIPYVSHNRQKNIEEVPIFAKLSINCPVCDQVNSNYQLLRMQCTHTLHTECLLPYIQLKINQSQLKIKCPCSDCNQLLSQSFLRKHLNTQDLHKYYRFSAFMFLEKKNDWIQCPQPRCKQIFRKNFSSSNIKWYVCNTTRQKMCIKCNKLYHPKFSDCSDYIKSLDPNSNQFKLMEMMTEKGWKQCPQCKHFVQKSQGCNHIKCKCQYEFCYACQGPYPKCNCLNRAQL